MILMEQIIELTIGDTANRRYVIDEQLDDGRVILRPQTQLDEMLAEVGSRAMTSAEFAELIAPHVGPPDDEG
ncbi:MAG: hypothetical protein ACR2LV_10480 [Solirubrobacteraceae bacterium]